MVRLSGQSPLHMDHGASPVVHVESWFEQENLKHKHRPRVGTDPINRVDRGHHHNTDLDVDVLRKTILMA